MPLANQTLKKYIEDKKRNNEYNIKIFEKVFDSLINIIEIIHQNKIIHRDIKPENIFIFENKLVLGDFDIAQFDKEEYVKLVKTQKNDRLAKFYFSAPE
jgi:serine/threonine-protein kinase